MTEIESPVETDSLVVTGMTWIDGEPLIRVRRNGAAATLDRLIGFRLRYSTGPDAKRHCVGHKPFRDRTVAWVDCDRPPLHDGRTCDRCAASDATFASQLHHAHTKGQGELDSAVRVHLEQPNNLYLAIFRDGSLKVGTSTSPRLQTRLTEQGAWHAAIVASTTDGFAVRSLEDRVTVELGLSQSVSVKRKIDGLIQPMRDERLLTELDRWATNVHRLIESQNDDRVEAQDERWTTLLAEDPIWEAVHPYPLKLQSGNHDIECLSASGRAILITRPGSGDHFVVDLRAIYGVELTLGEIVADELAVQDSLF